MALKMDRAAVERKRQAMSQVASSDVYADRGEQVAPPALSLVTPTSERGAGDPDTPQAHHSTPLTQPGQEASPEPLPKNTSPSDPPLNIDPIPNTAPPVPAVDTHKPTPATKGKEKAPRAKHATPSPPSTSATPGELLESITRVHPVGNAAALPTLRVPLPDDLYDELMEFVDFVADRFHMKVRWQALITELLRELPGELSGPIESSPTSRQSWQLAGRMQPETKAALEKLGRKTRPRTSSTALVQHQLRVSLASWKEALQNG